MTPRPATPTDVGKGLSRGQRIRSRSVHPHGPPPLTWGTLRKPAWVSSHSTDLGEERQVASGGGYLDLSVLAPKVAGKQGADRMFIVGRSGSGKSYLEKALLELYDTSEKTPSEFRAGVVIFDPNGNFDYPAKIVHSPDDVLPTRQFPVIKYRPSVKLSTPEGWNRALQVLYEAKERTLLAIDELTALEGLFGNKRFEEGNFLTGYMGRGRARGKAAIIVTQRPSAVPLTTIANAERFCIFDMPLDDDRERMAGVVGRYTTEVHNGEVVRVDLRDRKSLGQFQFWYYGPNVEQPVRVKVRG